MKKTKKTKKQGDYILHTFPAVAKEAKGVEHFLNFSLQSAEGKDEDGNPVHIYIWINGSWLIEYKGKQYLMNLDDNITALVEYINTKEKNENKN